jgi:alanyl-tRNA synthetase
MKTNEIRRRYLDFFKSKGHTECPSDVLVPKWDKTVLFTPAGMNQFKDHFLGKVDLDFTRATTSQKCLRTGDIENVGRTAYHHTFFEMLGNFSFGDYFKRDAIHWAWEFLTDKSWLGLNPDQLTVTVYLDDDEASDIWHKEVGLSLDRIERLGEDDNFWPAGAPTNGPDGVSGPCSEIFFHPENGPECEIWNLVFTQFDRVGDPPNNLHPLPSKNIDTGMGLERIAATLQGVSTNYHIDILLPIVEAAADVVGRKYDSENEDGRRLRRIADHVRACTMSIHENVYPGSQKEEYVIRRLLRRAVLQGHEMGLREPFLYQLVPEVVTQMADPYPDLKSTADRVADIIKHEETSFFGSLDDGLERIESIFSKMESSGEAKVDGKEAADLYQTYGIPAELFAAITQERKLEFDWDGYNIAMDQHGIDSGKGSKGVMGDFGPIDDIKREVKSTEFLAYELVESAGVVCGLIKQVTEGEKDEQKKIQFREKALLPDSDSEQFVVLDRTPFYAESGGQVGDTGVLAGPSGKFKVVDTQKNGDVFIHLGNMIEGEIKEGETVTASVDETRRNAIRRAHSATHVLHYALQQTLGEHAQQRGSKVTDDMLRFDFSNLNAVEPKQLAEIEKQTIEKVNLGGEIRADILPLAKAKGEGAMMLFGEKYPDPVRMVSIGEFSKELCGGIHLDDIGQAEAFEIISEESVSSGTRRIVALTGDKAKAHQQSIEASASKITDLLGVSVMDVPAAVERLANEVKDLKKQLGSGKKSKAKNADEKKGGGSTNATSPSYIDVRNALRSTATALNTPLKDVADRVVSMTEEVKTLTLELERLSEASNIDIDALIEEAELLGEIKVLIKELPNSNSAFMRQMIDQIRKKTTSIAVFFATSTGEGKVLLSAGVSNDLIKSGLSAGNWVREIAPVVGGGGGGKPDLAQAGGKKPEMIGEALSKAMTFIKDHS